MRKAASVLGSIVVILLMAAAAFTFLGPHFGWEVDAVISGSMEPQLHTGALVVTRPVAPDTILPGDIITFFAPVTNRMTTHRVVAIENNPTLSFCTKGDANEEADPNPVATASVKGVVCFNIPYVGYLTKFLKTLPGLLICLCLPALVIIITEIRNIRRAVFDRYIY
jgi:signal peptidase I